MAGSSSSSRTNMKLVSLHLTIVKLSASAGQTVIDRDRHLTTYTATNISKF